ncbi:MAG: hypothetical protein CMK07_14705 [Ponticaulis sp.]|nr:hypothetical protein [Ponticaulis sp.]
MSKAVELARCSSLEEAVILSGMLQANGIEASVADFNMSSTYWMVSMSQFGRVLVPEAQYDEAREIVLDRMQSADSMLTQEIGEPEDDVKRRDRWKAWAWIVWDTFFLFPLTAILVVADRLSRGERIWGFGHEVRQRRDQLYAPFRVSTSDPAD